ncbi:MAG: cupin domain-containing protein [Pseudomonadota bacterium]|nr:cupin domain-containing protein [Pseudomonadota bacterium]
MTSDQFRAALASAGFTEIANVTREANGLLDEHAHPFEANALVTAGELTLRVDGTERSYRTGEVFHLPAMTPHSERYGPDGVSYLVGRK